MFGVIQFLKPLRPPIKSFMKFVYIATAIVGDEYHIFNTDTADGSAVEARFDGKNIAN